MILTLATAGVFLSACVTGLGLHYIAKWEWSSALLFSVLIAATDPVSVIATLKEAKKKGRLRFLIEAESLFNDGTAAVAFTVSLSFVLGGKFTPIEVGRVLIGTIGGGILCGVVVAIAALLLAGRTDDHLVEITLTTLGAYGSFLLAEHFGFSGVLATLTAGLVLGNVGPHGAISAKGKLAVESFREYAAFVATSLVFLLLGITGTKENFLRVWPAALAAIVLVLAGRAAAILSDASAIFTFVRTSERGISTCCSGAGFGALWPWLSPSAYPQWCRDGTKSSPLVLQWSLFRCLFRELSWCRCCDASRSSSVLSH